VTGQDTADGPARDAAVRTVLVVRRASADLVTMVALLKAARYETLATTDFARAKGELDSSRPPDLLIADVRLGAFNGLHLAILGSCRTPPCPAILLDVTRDRTLEEDACRHGGFYLVNPTLAELAEAAARILAVSNLPDVLGRRVWPAGRLAGLGATPDLHDGLLGRERVIPRRWARKEIRGGASARIAGTAAIVVNISYGGFCFEARASLEPCLAVSFTVSFPAASLSVQAERIWSRQPASAGAIRCGAAVCAPPGAWRSFVDHLA
jgi:CheY-like chemotaxis protein